LDTVRELVLKLLSEELQEAIRQDTVIDDKSRLQEIIQAKYRAAPVYRLVGAVGPDHDKRFTVEVMGGGVVLGMGSGKSKKMAETEAARLALKKLAASFTQ
jgi:ribonuclease-3